MPTLQPTRVHVPSLQPSLTAALRQHFVDMLGQPTGLELSTDDLNFVLQIVKKTDEKVEVVSGQEQKILMDRNASDEGKSKQLAALAEKSVPEFAFLARIVAQHEKEIAAVERKLFARLQPPENEQATERLIRELRAGELRAGLEGDNRDAAFLRALEHDDFETALALLTAPGGSWVSDEILERGKAQYAQRTNAAALAGMTSLSIVRDRVAGVLEFVKAWFLRLGANPATVEKSLSV